MIPSNSCIYLCQTDVEIPPYFYCYFLSRKLSNQHLSGEANNVITEGDLSGEARGQGSAAGLMLVLPLLSPIIVISGMLLA